jgi:formate-nitrite transporter family protein
VADGKRSSEGGGTGGEDRHLSEEELEEVEEHTLLPAPFVYQIVRREGARELQRPFSSLWWSGFSAGISIGLSVLLQAVLDRSLPDASWRPLVASFGYTAGFVVVILSRQQLFTENTITAILPLMLQRSPRCLAAVARLWLTVAAANLAGAVVFAAFWTFTGAAGAETTEAMRAIGRHVMENGWGEMFVKAVAAGYLMAAMVWLLAGAEEAKLWVIVLVTYIIAVLGLTHVVAGGVEVLMLVWAGETSVPDFLLRFGVPVFLGNVVGGTGMFSVVVYAQVRAEVETDDRLGKGDAKPE